MKISSRIWMIDFLKSLSDFFIVLCIGILIDYLFSEPPSLIPMLVLVPYVVLLLVRRYVKSFPLLCILHILIIVPMLYMPVLLRSKIVVAVMTVVMSILSFYYRTHLDEKTTYSALAQRMIILAIAAFFSDGIYRELYLVTVAVNCVSFVLAIHICNLNDSFSLINKNQQHEKAYVIMNNNRIMIGFVMVILMFGAFLPTAADFAADMLSRIPNPFENISQQVSVPDQVTSKFELAQHDNVDLSALDAMPTNGIVVAVLRALLSVLLIGTGIAMIYMFMMMIKGIFEYIYAKKYPMDQKETIMPEFLQAINLRRKGKMHIKTPMNKVRRMYYKKVSEQINKGVKIQNFNTPNEIKAIIMQNEDITELTEQYMKVRYGSNSH